jgi:hypothetical protein
MFNVIVFVAVASIVGRHSSFIAASVTSGAKVNSGACAHLWTSAWQRVARGVDLTKLDLQPVRDTLHRKNGVREPLFDLTCFQRSVFSLSLSDSQRQSSWAADARNHTIQSKSGDTRVQYSLPDDMTIDWQHWIQPHWPNGAPNHSSLSTDQLEPIKELDLSYDLANQTVDPISRLQPEVRTFEVDEYAFARQQLVALQLIGNRRQSSWWADAGFAQTADFSGAFKMTQKFKRLRWQRFVNARIGHEARVQLPTYRVQLPELHRLPLSRRFRNAVERLNASGTGDSNEYEQMIHLFGTHFLHQIEFGGSARVAFRKLESADGIDLNKLDEIEGFDHKNSFDFEIRHERVQSEENFAVELGYFRSEQVVYEKTVTFYGGMLPEERHPLSAWADSVPLNPWIIGGIAIPISELIDDPIKQTLMRQSIASYLDKGELLSTKEALKSLQQIPIWNEKLNEQLNKVNALNENPSVTHEAVLSASRTVQELIDHELLELYRNHTFITLQSDKTPEPNRINGGDSMFCNVSLVARLISLCSFAILLSVFHQSFMA